MDYRYETTQIIREIMADPIVQECTWRHRKAEAEGRGYALQDSVDVLGDRADAAVRILWQYLRRPSSGDQLYEEVQFLAVKRLAEMVLSAPPFLWAHHVIQSLPTSWESSEGIILDGSMFPHRSMYWTFTTGYGGVESLAIFVGEKTCQIYQFFQVDPVDGPKVTWTEIPFNELPTRAPQTLAMCSFLNSPYIPKTEMKVDRPLRRRSEKATGRKMPPITYVDLRAEIREEKSTGTGEGPKATRRWIVRGHFRWQWYPSEGCHRQIYIQPFVKGPEGGEWVQKTYRVKR